VVAYARREAGDATTPRDIAVRLYYAVRDGIRYDPYRIDLRPPA
jgi:transglutaminase-like putative cysteine protease